MSGLISRRQPHRIYIGMVMQLNLRPNHIEKATWSLQSTYSGLPTWSLEARNYGNVTLLQAASSKWPRQTRGSPQCTFLELSCRMPLRLVASYSVFLLLTVILDDFLYFQSCVSLTFSFINWSCSASEECYRHASGRSGHQAHIGQVENRFT